MTDKLSQTLAENYEKKGSGKTGAAIIAAGMASYFMTYCSLHGIDFEVIGIPSELVKATIVGHMAGFIVWFTPQNFVQEVKNGILFVRGAIKTWWIAARDGTE